MGARSAGEDGPRGAVCSKTIALERNLQMAKFLFVYRGSNEVYAKMTPEQRQQNMEKWGNWIREALQKGWMVDPGQALTQEGRVVKGNRVVTDGPFVESKEIVGGFSIVQADTIAAAAELAKECPALLAGGSVEVRCLLPTDLEKWVSK
jgi:hypothetical protein